MITSITRFQLPPGVPTEAVKKGFLEVASHFKHPSGLLRKYFLISEDGKTGGGVYLWNSMEEARTFSEGVLRSMIRDKFQVDPSIEYYEAPVIVDNVTSEIIAEGGISNRPSNSLQPTGQMASFPWVFSVASISGHLTHSVLLPIHCAVHG